MELDDTVREAHARPDDADGESGAPAGDAIPTRVGRFAPLEEVDRGGMGVVFAAYDPRLDRRVAIELVRLQAQPQPASAMERALAEARAMAKVAHPNVITVYEVGEHALGPQGPRGLYVAMEFVEGQTLRKWIDTARPSPTTIVSAYLDAARGLSAVHAAGLVHRDFKPDNAMRSAEGRIRVMDFGIARAELDGSVEETVADSIDAPPRPGPATKTGLVAGTRAYLAPERYAGEPASPASDQFAWCVALYEGLCGRRPYADLDRADFVKALLDDAPVPRLPSDVAVPSAVRRALARGLAKKPEERFASMAELVDAMQRSRSVVPPLLVAGLGGALAVGGWLSARPDSTLCTGAEDAIASAYDDQTGPALEAAFTDVAEAYADQAAARTTALLDAYAEAWRAQHREACEATRIRGERTVAAMDRQMACLRRRRVELEALVGELLRADADAIARAPAAVESLLPPQNCAELDRVDPRAVTAGPDIEDATRERFEQSIARIDAASVLGRTTSARQDAAHLLDEAQTLGDPGLTAAARMALAELDFTIGNVDDARSGLQTAYGEARVAGRPTLAGDAAFLLASLVGTRGSQAELEAAEDWWALGALEYEVAGSELPRQGKEVRARLLSHAGKRREAIALTEEVVADLERECGQCDTLVQRYRELATRHGMTGHSEDEAQYFRKAWEMANALHGPNHPVVLDALLGVAEIDAARGRYEQAETALAQVVAGRERTLGPDHPNTAVARNTRARVLLALGRAGEAVAEAERAVAAAERHDNAVVLATTLQELASALTADGRVQDARAALDRSIQALRAAFPDGHPGLGPTLYNRGAFLRKQGEHADALADFVAALELREAQGTLEDQERQVYLSAITAIHRELGDDDEVERWGARSLTLAEKLPLSKSVANAYLTLAQVRGRRDRDAGIALLDALVERCRADEQLAKVAQCDRIAPIREELTPRG